MTHTIQVSRNDNDIDKYTKKLQRQIRTQRRKKFKCISLNVYRLQCHLAHVRDKDKDKVLKRPNIYYRYLENRWFKDIKSQPAQPA